MTGVTIVVLKNYLNITYTLDEALTSKLTGILTRAEVILQSYAGDEPEGTEDEQQLLLDCCRYIWNNAYEDFKTNFASDLMMLRAKYATESEDGSG